MSWHWNSMDCAPQDGSAIRVRVSGTDKFPSGPQRRELPWLVRFTGGHWRYTTTNAPLHSWHVPLEWSAEPRTAEEDKEFGAAIARAWGTTFMPSYGTKLPRLMLVKK